MPFAGLALTRRLYYIFQGRGDPVGEGRGLYGEWNKREAVWFSRILSSPGGLGDRASWELGPRERGVEMG